MDKALLESIRCPVLVMAGDRDNGVSVQHALNTAQMIKHSQLAIIPNAPHTAFVTNFPAVWAGITAFIK